MVERARTKRLLGAAGLVLLTLTVTGATAEDRFKDAVTVAPRTEVTCSEHLVADWAQEGEIDATYPLGCYRAAIRRLPEDIRAYSTAEEDITFALRARIARAAARTEQLLPASQRPMSE